MGMNHGWLRTDLWTNTVAIVLIFLISGISIQTKVLKDAFLKLHLHILIQLISLGLIPLYTFGLVYLLEIPGTIDPLLLQGILVMAVMPATVSTCIVYTQLAKGNVALSIIDSAFGNFIGIFISPLYLILIENKDIQTNYGSLILNLVLVVLLPFIIGQLMRIFFPIFSTKIRNLPGFKKYTGILVLVMVWTAFSSAFSSQFTAGISILYVFFIIVLLYLINLGLTALIFVPLQRCSLTSDLDSELSESNDKKFTWVVSKGDVIAALCTVPQKTMAMGLPLIQLVYANRPNDIAILGLPLIMYHAVQLFINGLLIPVFKRYNNGLISPTMDDSSEEDHKSNEEVLLETL